MTREQRPGTSLGQVPEDGASLGFCVLERAREGERFSVGSESKHSDADRDWKSVDLLPRGRVPEPDLLRGVADCQQLAIGGERKGPDDLLDIGKLEAQLHVGRVVEPDAAFIGIAIAGCDGQGLAIGRKRDAQDLIGQGRERAHHLAVRDIPEVERPQLTPGDEPLAVG